MPRGSKGGKGGGNQDNSTIKGNRKDNLLEGTDNGETIMGLGGNDQLFGFGGNDYLYGDEGNDLLDGGSGDDRLVAGFGDDTLLGGADNDRLSAGGGNDSLDGGDGDDFIQGGHGNDTMDGGSGYDIATFEEIFGLDDGTGVTIVAGNFTMPDGTTYDGYQATFYDGNGGVETDHLIGIEEVRGSNWNDSMVGGSGNDYLVGAFGDDTLKGGDGADRLYGSVDDDLLVGDAGADEFVFLVQYDGRTEPDDPVDDGYGDGHDVISDWAAGDTIVFLANENMDDRYTITEDTTNGHVVISYGQNSSITVLNATESDLAIEFVSELDAL